MICSYPKTHGFFSKALDPSCIDLKKLSWKLMKPQNHMSHKQKATALVVSMESWWWKNRDPYNGLF